MFSCYGSNTLSSEHAEESVQKNRRQLQEQIQIKNDNLIIIFQKISKLEYLSNACACPDLAEDSIVQVSFLHHDAALIFDEIDRMQRELNDLEYTIRTFIDVEISPEQKQNKKFPKLCKLKDILMIELSGGGKRKKKSTLPDNQTLINGFFSVDSINIAANEGIITVNHNFGTFIFNFQNDHYPCVTPLPLCSCD